MERERSYTIISRAIRTVFRSLSIKNADIDRVDNKDTQYPGSGIFSVMKISGDLDGEVRVYADRESASMVSSAIAHNDMNGVLPEMESGISELCNLISGTMKRISAQQDIHFNFTFPETRSISADGLKIAGFFMDHNFCFIITFEPCKVYIDVTL